MSTAERRNGNCARVAFRLLGITVLLAHNLAAGADLLDCRNEPDDAERLRCYDALPEGTELPAAPAVGESPAVAAKPAFEERLEKERDLARRAFAVIPHRPNYILTTYNGDPNLAPFQAMDPNADLDYQELKFQISLRVPLYNKMFRDNGDLWFGYTQFSFWQAYNWDRSAPFRETNFEPEFGLSFHTDFSLLGLRHRLFSVGFAHQSNGRGDLLSRSWNRLWATFQFERGNSMLIFKPWYRIPESAADDNNPDILDYIGRAELRGVHKRGDQVFSFMLRNNLRGQANRSGLELDWSFPLSRRLKGLVQYWSGYGESLIDYDVRARRIGVGILVEDWL